MALEWFTTQAPQQQKSDYKIAKSTIVITESGLNKLPSGAALVKLGYDAERNVIAIAPAEPGDKTTFKLARRGRGAQHQITAKKLFERFTIAPFAKSIDGNFEVEGDVIFASLMGGDAPVRRRRRKNAASETK
ncbi:MAG: hypothetical protein ABIY70_23230 [Capsulimonas sp.]|uniref:hypothetical protein n=1 Tax=Capsulimonas sp. TaxID=2494211 RepID=UPI0032655022